MGEIDAQERSSVRSRNESRSDQVPPVLSPADTKFWKITHAVMFGGIMAGMTAGEWGMP
jgi:hypothetical protein